MNVNEGILDPTNSKPNGHISYLPEKKKHLCTLIMHVCIALSI